MIVSWVVSEKPPFPLCHFIRCSVHASIVVVLILNDEVIDDWLNPEVDDG